MSKFFNRIQKNKPKEIHENIHRKQTKWWAMDIEEVMDRLSVDKKIGLTKKQIKPKRDKHGRNELPDKEKKTWLDILTAQVKSTMIVVLIVASLISLLLDDALDALVIFLAVVINIIFGFWQEWRTGKALEALRNVVVSYAKVIRDKQKKEIETIKLLPGDIVILEAGDKVPADIRLFETVGLSINEAVLTGETEPREKNIKTLEDKTVLAERDNMAYMGTVVTQGNGLGVVVETGVNTSVGNIAELVAGVEEGKTPLQERLDKFAIFLTKTVLVAVFALFVLGIFLGHTGREMFITAIALAVSAIPEGLLVVVTMILTVGMQRILKKKALVRQLLATETLGSTTVICTDKTGTLTEGKMEVARAVTLRSDFDLATGDNAFSAEEVSEQMFISQAGMLCNNAYISPEKDATDGVKLIGNLTEKALLLAGHRLGLNKDHLEDDYPRLDEIPFDSSYKFMMTLHHNDDDHNIIYLKGAPEKILFFSDYVYDHEAKKKIKLDEKTREKFINTYEQLSKEGLRTLAIGYKIVDKSVTKISDEQNIDPSLQVETVPDKYTNFVFIGILGIKDPLRKNAKETLELASQAGIETVILTGDNKFTATQIAREAGLDIKNENIIEGEELAKMSETELVEKVRDIKVYARVTPHDKLKIIDAWQEKGGVIAMTGDGVNDAPALKKASIGVALGSGTDVAKEVADIVLLDNNFKSIVSAVREGRIIYENVKKVILYFLSDSFTGVFVIAGSIVFGWPLPIIASQIIWVNLIADTFPALAMTQDPSTHDVMKDKPVDKNDDILGLEPKFLVGFISLFSSAIILLIFWLFWQGDPARYPLANTISFVNFCLLTLFFVFSIRDLTKPVWKTNILGNKYLVGSFFLGFFLQMIAVYLTPLQKLFHTTALNLTHWLIIIGICLVNILVIEGVKYVFNKIRR